MPEVQRVTKVSVAQGDSETHRKVGEGVERDKIQSVGELSPKSNEMPAADAKRVTGVPLEQSDSDLHMGEGVEKDEIQSVGELSPKSDEMSAKDEIQSVGVQSQVGEKMTDVQIVIRIQSASDSDLHLGWVKGVR